MLLPDKHITLAGSVVGLGGFLLAELDRPRTVDQLYQRITARRDDGAITAYHDLDSVLIALAFLYLVGAIEVAPTGAVRKCVS